MLAQLAGYYSARVLTQAELVADLFGASQQGALYDPSASATVFQERTGAAATTPAGADDPVGTILDVSGNGNHRTASSDAARPLLRTNGALWWLEHDGVDDLLVCLTASLEMQPPWYLACVLSLNTTNAGFSAPGFGITLNFANYYALKPTNGVLRCQIIGENASSFVGFNHLQYATGLLVANQPAVSAAQITSGSVALRVNGTTLNQAQGWTNETLLVNRIGSGSRALDTAATPTYREYVAIGVNSVLSAQQLIHVDRYLAQKAGITL